MLKLQQNPLFRVFVITSFPLFFILFGLWEVIQLKSLEKLSKDKAIAYEGLKQLEAANKIADFIGIRIYNAYTLAISAKSLKFKIEQLRNQTGINLKYIIWTNKEKVKFYNFAYSSKKGNYENACQLIYNCYVLGQNNHGQDISKKEYNNLKLVFGPHFIFGNMNIKKRTNLLLKTDSANILPRLWIKTKSEHTLIVFIDPSELKIDSVKKSILTNLEKTNKSIHYAVKNKKGIICNQNELRTIIPKVFPTHSCNTKLEKHYKNYRIISNYIDDQTTEFAFIEIPKDYNLKRFIRISIILLLLTFILFFWVYRTYYRSNSEQSRLLLQSKLLIFFVLFNIIPITIFILLSYNYLSQLKTTEIARVYTEGTRFLEHIDNLYLSENTHQIRKLTKRINAIKTDLQKNCITASNVVTLVGSLTPNVLRFTLVGSVTKIIATEEAIYNDDNKIAELCIPHIETRSYKDFVKFSGVMKLMAKMFLTSMNRIPVKPITATKFELTAEAIGENSPIGLVQKFYKANGSISNFGFGEAYSPVFTLGFSILGSHLLDYSFIYAWDAWSLPIHYITRLYSAFNKNDLGLKVMVTVDDRKIKFPTHLNNHENLIKYGLNLNESSNDNQVKIGKWQGNNYYILGYKGKKAKLLNYIGMYPCKKIDKKLYEQQVFFIVFGVVGFLISVLFGLSISREIMSPIGDLKVGINALQKKNYSFRIENLGNNEFGNLAKIINETNADQEEIYKTDDFSTKLFSNTGKEIDMDNARIYGQASAFCDLGKDYLDIFTLQTPDKIGILWGQIEKIGIASTLLAAFVKSSTLIYQKLENDPQLFVEKISRLINRINENEMQSIISFQYLLLNTKLNTLEIVNHGCNLPIILDKRNEVRTCKTGILALNSGDTLIAYSPNFLDIENFTNHLTNKDIASPKRHYEEIITKLIAMQKLDLDTAKDSSMVILKIN